MLQFHQAIFPNVHDMQFLIDGYHMKSFNQMSSGKVEKSREWVVSGEW